MAISLHKDLASSGWHSSIITTYSVDPTFYDAYVERRLRTYGIKNNILIADARMLKMALEAMPETFVAAGVRYAVVPVTVTGAFHPKIHLRLAESKARLVIGSANVTAAGWGKNQEVVTQLDWGWRENDADDNAAMGHLVAKAYRYLAGWLEEWPGDAIRYKLQMIERQTQWLRDIVELETPVSLSDGTAADLLCESGGNSPTMLTQFSELARQEKIRQLIVISPYWDASLRGFRDLRVALGNPPTIVGLNPKKNSFPLKALRPGERLKFVSIEDTKDARFVHAKIFVAQTSKADHVLFGSANCSDDALGYAGGVSRNAEVSVYRRLPPGRALQDLQVDLSKVVSAEDILAPVRIPASAAPAKASAPAGVIELKGSSLTWWPPQSLPAKGAVIKLCGVSVMPQENCGGKWQAEFDAELIFPVIAKVHYNNGVISDPVVVHCETQLRKAAPGLIDPRLKEALDKSRGPDGDLLELAALAHVIFETTPRKVFANRASERTGKKKDAGILREVVEYETEQQFLNAMEMQPGTGKTGRTDENDPGFLDLLAIINRNIAGSVQNVDADYDEQDLLVGDNQDDEGSPGDNSADENEENRRPQASLTQDPTSVKNIKGLFTAADVFHRRNQLVSALDLFDVMLQRLEQEPSLITSRLAVQTMFVFRLMRYGVNHVHKTSNGGPQTLMILSDGGSGSERDCSFALRAALILKKIWTGDKSIASKIQLDPTSIELPDDIYGFIVVSRWALGRAYLEAKCADARSRIGKASKLTCSLRKMGSEIYAATAAKGQIDEIEERKTIAEMDQEIGCTSAQTEELLKCLREFAVQCATAVTCQPASVRPISA